MHLRLSRARQGAAAAFPVRISRWRLLRRGDAATERRRLAVGRAEAAGAPRRLGDRSFDRAVRQTLGDAGRARARSGLSGLYARRGEVQAAKAAAAAGVPFTFRRSAPARSRKSRGAAPLWFQLYIVKDRGFVSDMIARAKEAGCGALLLTVDLAVPGTRYRDYRAGLSGSMRGPEPRDGRCCSGRDWAWDVALRGRPMTMGNLEPLLGSGAALADLMGWVGAQFRRQRHVERRRVGPLAMGRAAGHQRHPRSRRRARSGGERRGRHRRVQPWRPPARRRAVERARLAGDRRCRRRTHADPRRWRRSLGPRRRPDARARRRLRAAGPRLGLCARRARRGRRRACAEADRCRDAGGDGADRLHQHRSDRPRISSSGAAIRRRSEARRHRRANKLSTSAAVIGSANR